MKTKRIKILYTIPNFDTAGSGKVVYDLVKNLDKEIFDPEICCFHGRGAFFKEIKKLNVKIHFFNFTTSYYPLLTFPLRVWKIRNFFKKQQFDIIHSWHWSSDFSEPLAAKLAGIYFVYTKKSMGWGNRAWKWKSLLSIKIITVNTNMKQLFFKNYKNKVQYMPLGIDLDHFIPQEKRLKIPEGIEFQNDDFVIVSISNLLPIKGIDVLIKAVNQINDKKIKLCIVGDDTGDYAQELKDLAAANKNIQFLGLKSDVRPYHTIADLFVICTLALGEGLPLAPIEAMASQRIVIGSDVPGVRDVLSGFKQCLVRPEDVTALAQKIKKVINMNSESKENLQEGMRNFVVSNYNMQDFISNHEKLYKELIQ